MSVTAWRRKRRSARTSCSTSISPRRLRATAGQLDGVDGHRGRTRPGRPDAGTACSGQRTSSPSSATNAACRRWRKSRRIIPAGCGSSHGDALKTDMAALVSPGARIVANLPYNIATPLLTGWLTIEPWPPFYASMTLMFQREVAERIVAKRAMTPMAVSACWRTGAADPEIAFDISPRPSRRHRRSPRRWSISCRVQNRCPAILQALERVTAGRLRPAAQDAAPKPQERRRRARCWRRPESMAHGAPRR